MNAEITIQEFESLLVPHLRWVGTLPKVFSHSQPTVLFADLLHCCSDRTLTQWQKQSLMFDKYSTENLDFLRVVVETQAAMQSYLALRNAANSGAHHVVGFSAANACPTCRADVNGKRYRVVDLLIAYEQPDGASIILPHAKCEHTQRDGGGWCRCCWRVESPIPPNVDAGFTKWLNKYLNETSSKT